MSIDKLKNFKKIKIKDVALGHLLYMSKSDLVLYLFGVEHKPKNKY